MSSNNFTDILKEISSSKTTIPCYAPSTKEEVNILPLTLAQQKNIIETSIDSSLAALFFNNTFFKILKQNIKGDISKYNTIDRVNFALHLRSQLQDSYTNGDIKVNIQDVLTKNKTVVYNLTPTNVTVDNFTFSLCIPDLLLDDKINSILINKYKNENLNGAKLKNLISDLFVHEILKFTTKLKVNDKEVDLHNDFTNAASLLEKIDSRMFLEVTKYINVVRDIERNYAMLPGSNTNIDIVPDFFIV
jgi:hypothetical protein